MKLRPVVPCLALPLVLAACPGGDEGAEDEGTLVVGVQAEEISGLLGRVHVVAKVDGVVAKEEDVSAAASAAAGGLPKELTITAKAGARVEVTAEGFGTSGPMPMVTKRATTFVLGNTKKLLRMQLEARCATLPALRPGDPTPGGPPPPVCAAPQTCSGGVCVAEEVPVSALETYETGWPSAAPDICRPANHGPPEMFVGQGQNDYLPLTDGQTLQLEKGPQGGHHIWLAVRMRNLKQASVRTSLTAKIVGDPATNILPTGYVFSYVRDEGGYCKIYGLRFQLDAGGDLSTTYKKFLGKELEVTVELADTIGGKASATRRIRIADKVLCPDGTTTSCN